MNASPAHALQRLEAAFSNPMMIIIIIPIMAVTTGRKKRNTLTNRRIWAG
jgi:hypothetical protein